ncbi:hypothetical protein BT93_I1047 [Corymbia citriodora subsp. variegata]|nr:hypothetical protein BT93_I1047 [Corymbia citriodora subsp. variegata]
MNPVSKPVGLHVCRLMTTVPWILIALALSHNFPTIASKTEVDALRRSTWWHFYGTSNPSESHCTWRGISCNNSRSVVEINLPQQLYYPGNLSNMDFSLLPNLTSLQLPGNYFTGNIPLQICALPKLRQLNLSNNNLTGELPLCLQNLTMLEVMDISSNLLHGTIPSTLVLLSNLRLLNLSLNDLDGFIPLEIGNCVNLYHIDLKYNSFVGPIPSSLAKLKNLVHLYLGRNNFNGSIPSEIGNLTNLAYLSMEMNKFHGSIPLEIGNLKRLIYLDLSFNFFNGTSLVTLVKLKNLVQLYLGRNCFSGSIPSEIGNLANLTCLSLEENFLSGSIPSEICKLKSLVELRLRSNFFIGHIPSELGELKNLTYLDLSINNFIGKIPHELGSLFMLRYLNLGNNSLHGTIPKFKKLLHLEYINLSYNHLTGNIPNDLAHVPNSDFQGNEVLKQIEVSTPTRMSGVMLMIIFIPLMAVAFIFYLILGSCIILRRRTESKQLEIAEKNGDFLSIWNYDGRIAYEDIINATEGFDIKYCIGTGGYGSVYRAQLPNGKIVAVKKLHRLEAEDPSFYQSFQNEVKHLIEVRHRSIIRLHGFCLHKRCMFLVYEYMEKGSLFCALREDVEAMQLDWSKRLNIVWDIAHALSYLHHGCARPIVHRDISSNNILLDNKMQAFLSDFGTARLLEPNFSSNLTINIVGTHGYIAPAMEIIMGEHPSDIILMLSTLFQDDIMLHQILDPRLPIPRQNSITRSIVLIVSLAFACLSGDPKSRPTMKQVSEAFLAPKLVLPMPFHSISLAQLQKTNQGVWWEGGSRETSSSLQEEQGP